MSKKQPRSLARGFGVGPSPLNVVKLDLALIASVGLLLLVVVHGLGGALWTQIGILFAYGLTGMVWLVVRTRKVLRSKPPSGSGSGGA